MTAPNAPIIPVILSGGSGTRLWPLSRRLYPKQYLPLIEQETSILQDTLRRLSVLENALPPIVVCNEEHRFLAAEQCRALDVTPLAILLEPVGRNTAPAVAAAALQALREGEEVLLLVLPADHHIQDLQAFAKAVEQGARFATRGKLVTFGITPVAPETGYGYIKRGELLEDEGAVCHAVARFVEKPDLAAATRYLEEGEYLWNSGMFLFSAKAYLEELGAREPEMAAKVSESYAKGVVDLDFFRLDRDAFEQSPSDSIDYAVMEKTPHGVVIELSSSWSDVGSWSALWDIKPKDEDDNVTIGDVLTSSVKRSYLHSTGRLLAVVGVEDHVIVETTDAVMVAPKNRVQDVKALVDRLNMGKRDEASIHKKVYRPWGNYECIDIGGRFQVKRITVKPGAKLSLQRHYHRAEHWIVVKGTALVTRGEEVFTLSEDQSTYIPLGFTHRLENPGRIPLELVEVQTGSYLGEDDIVRDEDDFGRTGQK